jgi:hypothetical protein
MLGYYALYDRDDGWERGEPPIGIIVELTDEPAVPGDTVEYHAVMWSHWSKAWVYDPDTGADILNDLDTYGDRFRPVERDEAELITPAITGGEELPDEDTIRWIFQWRGDPPQAPDPPETWPPIVWPGTKPEDANGTQ